MTNVTLHGIDDVLPQEYDGSMPNTPKFSKRHYEVIAEEISINYGAYDPSNLGAQALRVLARDIADRFASDNPSFDRARFLKACGTEGRHA